MERIEISFFIGKWVERTTGVTFNEIKTNDRKERETKIPAKII